jgi:hypothetical protein
MTNVNSGGTRSAFHNRKPIFLRPELPEGENRQEKWPPGKYKDITKNEKKNQQHNVQSA